MPYSIEWEPQGVYCKFFGSVSIAEVHQLVDAVVTDARFDTLLYRITDCLEVTHQDVLPAEIDQVLAMDEAYSFANARPYEAAIATDVDIVELLRHWAASSPNEQQLCIFSTLADARKWLLNPAVI
jgi:hypothetical protein